MQKRQTDDERLLLKIYELALAKGNPYAEINLLKAARLSGQKEKAAYTIAKHLAQANFLKKVDDERVHLTEKGCELAREYLE